jgi:hypothetical protein
MDKLTVHGDAIGLGVLEEVKARDGVESEASGSGVDKRVGALPVFHEADVFKGSFHGHCGKRRRRVII